MGLIDCNRYICRDFDMGRPLLHAHTFTETADLTEGDTIYLPAGRIVDRRYERLDVHVKEDGTFRRLAGGESCAFAYAADGGEMTPLLRLRAAEFAGIPGATTIPTQLTADPPLLRRALTGLLAATRQPGPHVRLPPVSGGYFGRRANRRTLRQIGEALAAMPEFARPLRFALLPAPLLSLLPPAEFAHDRVLVEELAGTVLRSTTDRRRTRAVPCRRSRTSCRSGWTSTATSCPTTTSTGSAGPAAC